MDLLLEIVDMALCMIVLFGGCLLLQHAREIIEAVVDWLEAIRNWLARKGK